MRIRVLAGLVIWSSSSLAQTPKVETVTVPAIGAIFCVDPDDIVRIASKEKATGVCGVIPGGTQIIAINVKSTEGFKGGFGTADGINDGKAFAFLVAPSPPVQEKLPFSSRTFKLVSPNDVRNTPTKWQGRDIEFRNVNVYWVADDDVRILTGASVTVFARNVQGRDVAFLRENCETERESLSAKCKVSIRFSYSTHGEDKPSGLTTRTVIQTDDILVGRRSSR